MNDEALFGPQSITAGVPRVADDLGVMEVLDAHLAELTHHEVVDTWFRFALDIGFGSGVPVFARGSVRMLPLAWIPQAQELNRPGDRVRLWSEVRDAFTARAGWGRGIELDPRDASFDGYGRSLADAGAYRADWWRLGQGPHEVAVVLVCTHHPDGSDSVAVHVVPIEWLRWQPATKRRKPVVVPVTDLSWSWTDVVDLHRATFGVPAPDSNA